MIQTLETWIVIVSDDCNFGCSACKNEITSCIVFVSWNIIDKILTLWNSSVCVQSRESEILSEWSLQAGAYVAQWLEGGN